jgi:hypothetical protein
VAAISVISMARIALLSPEGCRTVAGGNTPGNPPH